MGVVAVPNISESRNRPLLDRCIHAAQRHAHVLDVHSDAVHNRSVLTVAGGRGDIVAAMEELASVAQHIDLTRHAGVHPRLGGLDVCPIVPFRSSMESAVDTARRTGKAIARRTGLPIYCFGEAAAREETRALPELRRGGLPTLIARATAGLRPDLGACEISPRRGVVCVGARGVLIAFNVWLHCDDRVAQEIAASVRTTGSGPPGLRALGFPMPGGACQVSMNLIDPTTTGVDDAFEAVRVAARSRNVEVVATEIVGLVPERFMPNPEKEAARLLMKRARSLETAMRDAGL